MDRLSGLDAKRVMHTLSSDLEKERLHWKPADANQSSVQVIIITFKTHKHNTYRTTADDSLILLEVSYSDSAKDSLSFLSHHSKVFSNCCYAP